MLGRKEIFTRRRRTCRVVDTEKTGNGRYRSLLWLEITRQVVGEQQSRFFIEKDRLWNVEHTHVYLSEARTSSIWRMIRVGQKMPKPIDMGMSLSR